MNSTRTPRSHFNITAHTIVLFPSQGKKSNKSTNKAGDRNATSIAKAVQQKKNEAAQAKREYLSEAAAMKKALAYAAKIRGKQAPKSVADMYGELRKPDVEDITKVPAAQTGETVEVKPNLGRKGPARHGGRAKVVAVSGVGGLTKLDVKYVVGGPVERGVGIDHFTKAPPAGFAKLPARAAKGKGRWPPEPPPPSSLNSLLHLPLKDALIRACRSGRKEGWRRELYYGKAHLSIRVWTPAQKRRPVSEYKEMKAYEEGAGVAKHAQRASKSGGQFVARTTQHNPYVELVWVGG